MSVVVVGVNERDAPLDLLERLAIAERDQAKVLAALCDSPNLSEAVILSTCLRTEVYAVADRFHDGLADIEALFAARIDDSFADSVELEDRLVVAYDEAAERHLFAVAAGIDSAVLGEGEILRQVRSAAAMARTERAAGPVLDGLFRHAVEVGKRVRTETAISRGITSLSHVAVALAARERDGSLDGARLLLIGAGEVGEGIADAVESTAPASVVVANRSTSRARAVAARLDGTPIGLDHLKAAVAGADVVLTATSAGDVLLDVDLVREAVAKRPDRPLVVIDAAMPRDVEPAVGKLDGVTLRDVGDLRAYADEQMATRRSEIARVGEIVEEELARYHSTVAGRSVAPVVMALRTRVEEIRLAELERAAGAVERLGPGAPELVDDLTRRIAQKLLHEPTVRVKDAAGSARGERLAEALRALFDL